MGKAVKKSSEEALDQALDKLVMLAPNKKTYDELTSLMFQLYCGNDYGLGNFSLSFLDKIESRWQSGRKKIAKKEGKSYQSMKENLLSKGQKLLNGK